MFTPEAQKDQVKMTFRQKLNCGFEGAGPFGVVLPALTYSLILLAVMVWTASTVPAFNAEFGRYFFAAEIMLSLIFLIEYVARLWSAERRLSYVFSFWGIIDLCATLPVLIAFGSGTNSFRMARLFRLARVIRLFRLGKANQRILDALHSVREELTVFVIMSMAILFFAASGIYFFEHEAQPDVFTSVPQSAWWAIATLTTVGYGDIFPITIGGKIFTSLILFLGLAIVAVPTGLISTALMAQRDNSET